jgi:hypothetical protein
VIDLPEVYVPATRGDIQVVFELVAAAELHFDEVVEIDPDDVERSFIA